MELSCLDNLIGVSPRCTAVVPTSNLYINDLDGISIEIADAIIDKETQSGIALLEQQIRLAQVEMANKVRAWIMPKASISTVIANDRAGIYDRQRATAAPVAGKQRGMEIDSGYSEYFTFFIHSVTYFGDTTEALTVYLYDRTTGETLDSYSLSAVADTPTTVVVNKGYSTNKNRMQFALVVAATGNSYKTRAYGTAGGSCRSCVTKGGNKYIGFSGTQVTTADAKVDVNFAGQSDTGGLSLDYSLQCSVEKFICNMANLIAMPLLYLAGANVARARRSSTRLNPLVRLYGDETEGMVEYYTEKSDETLKTILDNMRLPDDYCFSCNRRVRYVTTTP